MRKLLWEVFSVVVDYYEVPLWLRRLKRLPTLRETQVRSLDWEDSLEKEMATHSSTLAWKIPWTEEPAGLQTIGWQRVRHDWAHVHFHLHSHRLILRYPLCIQRTLLQSPDLPLLHLGPTHFHISNLRTWCCHASLRWHVSLMPS